MVVGATAGSVKCARSATDQAAALAGTPNAIDAALLNAARSYQTWKRVSDRANVAPVNCMVLPPGGVLPSGSADDQTHGRKLYYLFARDPEAYLAVSSDRYLRPSNPPQLLTATPVGQAIVKQTWQPVEAPPLPTPVDVNDVPARVRPDDLVEHEGRRFRTGEPMDLFIMAKLDPETPGTDEGWVYGVVSPDGREIRASGRLQNCMGCHVETGPERQFGLWTRP